MSSSSAPPAVNPITTNHTKLFQAVVTAASITCLIIFLICLRFACILFVDVCILRQHRRREEEIQQQRQQLGQETNFATSTTVTWRKLFSWWGFGRAVAVGAEVYEGSRSNHLRDNHDELPIWAVHNDPAQNIYSRRSQSQSQSTRMIQLQLELGFPGLQCKTLAKEDMIIHEQIDEQQQDEQEEENVLPSTTSHHVCSICLNELTVGDITLSPNCGHVFHRHCLMQWMTDYTRIDCPICRKGLFNEEDITKPATLQT